MPFQPILPAWKNYRCFANIQCKLVIKQTMARKLKYCLTLWTNDPNVSQLLSVVLIAFSQHCENCQQRALRQADQEAAKNI